MVGRRVFAMILIPILWALVTAAAASETLSVEPDRKRLYQDEVLTLTVKGTTTIDINLSNLFDFDTSSLPQPDIEKVAPDFEIIGQNQHYSIQTVNGEMVGEVNWSYQLAPKKPGELTIPALTFRGAESDPVTIEVIDGTPPEQNGSPRGSFIELSADKDSVYVQEQMVLSVKLFFNGNLIRGELSEPSHPNAIIESLGKQTEYTRFRDGMRYRVVERRYAIFPQQPGELSLPAIQFEGQTRDASGRLKFLRDSKQLFAVPVKDVPDGFSGDTWLPATALTLSETGLPSDPAISAGQNLSRSLAMMAEGLPGEALPPFNQEMPQGIRAYPENPERTTLPSENGLTARLVQTTALVPVEGGELTLPEIRIPWWDTESDSEKFATLPARTLQVEAVPGQPQSSAAQTGTARQPEPVTPATDATASPAAPASAGAWIWQTVALVLLVAWLVTGFGWWYSRRSRRRPPAVAQRPDGTEKTLFTRLCESARAGAPETPDHLIRWLQHWHPQESLANLGDAYRHLNNEAVEQEIRQLQARAYSANAGAAESWQGDRLVDALSRSRQALLARPAAPSPLPALYPHQLYAGSSSSPGDSSSGAGR